ncbi:secretion protein Por [Chryseobacterium lactis]|uniref:Secretion protein Por n=1 Tax=Chryseobacterium lactis TaxID=1241981 RepID=A0A3G6RJT2_CHRLC|nr:S8 family peptidase [Chryseobacterium lactis]AZA82845.1 T9SS C-terminal target domain-containing protein [Chryseobacterium lactis]AZB03227.1 T9SS C-terminal target domain-containing protein [Chryseobacterium lactis]PNW11296.1 secretion protein Por [Chryseobacterium lactis]
MNKIFISISTLIISLASAQNNNESLKREFEKMRAEDIQKFETYVAKKYGSNRNPEISKEIENQRTSLAGFTDGIPYFYTIHDTDQIKNSNSDFLQDGNITGLTGAFNGENIKFTIFDGSQKSSTARVFGDHVFFNNASGRITNKESSTLDYGDHATGVASFIGARDYPFTVTFVDGTSRQVNFKGIAPNSKIDAYSFGNSTLPGETTSSNVFQKIIKAQPIISNHSYGINGGWDIVNVNGSNAWVWRGNFTSSSTTRDMQSAYIIDDKYYDYIVYNNPSYIIVKSAGNYFGMGNNAYSTDTANYKKYYKNSSGNWVEFTATDTLPPVNCSQGYDCISPGSVAKNIITVAASDRITNNDGRYTTSADVIHSYYSSAGPRDDGGIKPDITAVGTDVASAWTDNNSTGGNKINVGSGTSFSAPIVTGIIGLWTQINKQLFSGNILNAASAKTLMIHSASEAGNIGPDAQFGWGFINAKKGAELLVAKSNNTIILNDETLTSGTPNKKTVIASGSEPLKVTISWIDPEYSNVAVNPPLADLYNQRNSKLINDLDLRIIDTTNNTVYLPWRLDYNSPLTAIKGDNTVDNVEQVIVDTPVAGRTYRIEVTNKGNLVNDTGGATPQNYSILVTGYSSFLGTKEVGNSNNNIAIAPTITKDIVKVLKAPKKSTFNVYDMTGKKLQSGTVNNDQESIDLSTYTKGIYIIEIKTGKDVISKKVIKE